jgi:hypothetical protein
LLRLFYFKWICGFLIAYFALAVRSLREIMTMVSRKPVSGRGWHGAFGGRRKEFRRDRQENECILLTILD